MAIADELRLRILAQTLTLSRQLLRGSCRNDSYRGNLSIASNRLCRWDIWESAYHRNGRDGNTPVCNDYRNSVISPLYHLACALSTEKNIRSLFVRSAGELRKYCCF